MLNTIDFMLRSHCWGCFLQIWDPKFQKKIITSAIFWGNQWFWGIKISDMPQCSIKELSFKVMISQWENPENLNIPEQPPNHGLFQTKRNHNSRLLVARALTSLLSHIESICSSPPSGPILSLQKSAGKTGHTIPHKGTSP